jgi:hypothetical protein
MSFLPAEACLDEVGEALKKTFLADAEKGN